MYFWLYILDICTSYEFLALDRRNDLLFQISQRQRIITEKISLMQYHMISGEKTVFQEQKYNPQEVQLLEKDETFKMDRVNGITFVQNKMD